MSILRRFNGEDVGVADEAAGATSADPNESGPAGGADVHVGTASQQKPVQNEEDKTLSKKELKHMMKQLQQKKMPTMMYQTSDEKGERNGQNPW